MNWFLIFCRQTGLAIHQIASPKQRQVLNKRVEEKKVDETVTLRRTTIDEVEIRKDG